MVTLSSEISVIVPGGDGLVINEVDYDQPVADDAEFVEIYNSIGSPVNLFGIVLYLVNGSDSLVYQTYDLSSLGSLDPGEYAVVAPATMSLPPGTARADLSPATNGIQNGAPDGVALVDTNSNTLLDALSYEGAITMASIPGVGTVSLVEGSATSAIDPSATPGSLSRLPNGSDTDLASSDWAVSSTPTPGAANVP